ncbi:MAG: YlxR family protein [Eubacteriales bacterium]|nr:YlxR family protein [Eubacteriales bacterium]
MSDLIIKRVPERTCIGCREKKPKTEMIRIAFYEGSLSVDRTGKAKGRGVYICDDPDCRAKAKKTNALQRAFRTGFDKETVDRIFGELENND